MEKKTCHLISRLSEEIGKMKWQSQVLSLGLQGQLLIIVLKETKENYAAIEDIHRNLKSLLDRKEFLGKVALSQQVYFSDKYHYCVPKKNLKAPRWIQHMIKTIPVLQRPLLFVVDEKKSSTVVEE